MRRAAVLLTLLLLAHSDLALAAAGGGSSSYSGGGGSGGGGSSSDGAGGWGAYVFVAGVLVFALILGTILTYGPRLTAWQWAKARLDRRAYRRRHGAAVTDPPSSRTPDG